MVVNFLSQNMHMPKYPVAGSTSNIPNTPVRGNLLAAITSEREVVYVVMGDVVDDMLLQSRVSVLLWLPSFP